MSEITDLLFSQFLPSPERTMAEKIRRQKDASDLAAANEKANSLNMLEFASQLSNNPGLAKGSTLLAKAQREQYGPVQMGQQGFMLPGTGTYTESPMYAENKEQDRQQKILNMMQLTEASNQRAADANALRLTIAQMNDARAREIAAMNNQRALDVAAMRGDRDQLARDKALDTNTQKLSNALQKANLPQERLQLEEANKTLDAYAGKDLPGYGRFQSYLPDQAVSGEAQLVRQSIQGVVNMATKALAGTAVSGSEERRVLRQIASGKGYDEKTLRKGIEILGKQHDASVNNILSGYDDQTLATYNARNPVPFTRAKATGGESASSKDKPAGDKKRLKFNAATGELE